MADLVRELSDLRYGAGIQDALGKIGRRIRDARNEQEARSIMDEVIPDLAKTDFGSPEFNQKFASALARTTPLEEIGATLRDVIEKSVVLPQQLRREQDQFRLNLFTKDAADYEKSVQQLHQDLRTGIDVSSRIPQLEQQRQNLIAKYPERSTALTPLPDEQMIQSYKGKGSNYQEKGITEKNGLTVSYNNALAKNVVTNSDGSIVDYNPSVHGRIIQTATPQSEIETEKAVLSNPGAVEGLATQWLTGGSMPLGFSGSSYARFAIAEKASELLNLHGLSTSDIPALQATYKATSGALNSTERQYNLVNAFERTAERNLQIALKQSDLVDRWDSPVLNKWKLWVEGRGEGSPEVNAFDAAVHVAANEIAKVTSTTTGNVVPEQERIEYRNLISTALNMKGFQRVTDILTQDMQNRRISYSEQISELRGKLKNWWTLVPGSKDEFDQYKRK